MVNSGVFQSLTQSLSRELDCARQIEKQMESLQEIESLQELRTAQSRLAALERTHQSALEARDPSTLPAATTSAAAAEVPLKPFSWAFRWLVVCHRVLSSFYAVFLPSYHQRSSISIDYFLSLSLLR